MKSFCMTPHHVVLDMTGSTVKKQAGIASVGLSIELPMSVS